MGNKYNFVKINIPFKAVIILLIYAFLVMIAGIGIFFGATVLGYGSNDLNIVFQEYQMSLKAKDMSTSMFHSLVPAIDFEAMNAQVVKVPAMVEGSEGDEIIFFEYSTETEVILNILNNWVVHTKLNNDDESRYILGIYNEEKVGENGKEKIKSISVISYDSSYNVLKQKKREIVHLIKSFWVMPKCQL